MIKLKHTCEFWTCNSKGNRTEVDIDISKFIEFLEINGFRNFENGSERQLVYIENNVLRKIEPFQLNSLIREYLKSLPEQLNNGVTRNCLIEMFHRKLPILIQKDQINTLQVLVPNFKKDSRTQSFKFFQNGFVEISQNSIIMRDYNELDGSIWQDQMINRALTLTDDLEDLRNGEFYRFLFNCMNRNEDRLNSILSIIGYLIHNYKDSSNAKAVILCDENSSDEANGGSGKSLTVYAISQFVKTVREDGKTFNSRSSFAFQQVEHSTELFFIDDVSENFDFETLFSPITGGMTIERKYKTRTSKSLKDSPKFVLTTNYTVIGEGSSFDRRKIELEFSEYYNRNNTPDMEFGHRLFEDWSTQEWSFFDNFMCYCVKFYLTKGIIPPKHINLKQRKLIQLTKREFVEFADALPRNKEFNKLSIYNEFIKDYPDFENIRQRTFTNWLTIYSNYSNQDLILHERHSYKDRFFTLFQKPKPVA